MTTTRRLDILAIIGCILAVAAIAVPTAISWSYRVPPEQWREIALRNMPNTDVRADFELLTEWPWGKDAFRVWNSKDWTSELNADEYENQKRLHILPVLAQATRKFPDSARIQFRLGTLGEKKQCPEALKRAASLDQTNALPLFVLAGMHAQDGRYAEALRLVTQGNQRSRVSWYPISLDDAHADMFSDSLVSSANSTAQLPCWMLTRQTVRQLSKYADGLRLSGNKTQALAILDQLQTMCSKLLHEGMVNSTDVSFGVAISAIAEKPARLIYEESGDKTGLARIAANEKERIRLKAGLSAYLDQMMPTLMQTIARFISPSLPLDAAGGTGAIAIFVSTAWWAMLRLKSKGIKESDHHVCATDRAFAGTFLVRVGALLVLMLAAITAVLSSLSFSSADSFLAESVGMIAGGVCSATLVLGIILWANLAYKKAFRAAVELAGETVPKPWKGYSIADKRERQRRLTGVMGGLMIALAVWGVLVSAYMKITMDAYPWQMERATMRLRHEEAIYVSGLVAGKIKVPQKYILEEQKKAAERKK